MNPSDYFVRTVDLPPHVRGVTVTNDDGTFSIYINSLFDDETRRKALAHELEHLERDHFYKDEPIGRQENEANGKTPPAAESDTEPVPNPAEPMPEGPTIPCFPGLRTLTDYLRSIDALSPTVEELSE